MLKPTSDLEFPGLPSKKQSSLLNSPDEMSC